MTLAQRVVQWQRQYGRHDLPWQNTRDPYRVWLSEIMLQQTQVITVMGYFERFLQRFPTVMALAQAEQDDVLALWSGLGYYSRARNLHRCAVAVVTQHGGCFPRTALALATLPGIGPSTAAAIASLCFDEQVAILDGNVRRVLTRVLGNGADMSLAVNEKALWMVAQNLVPSRASDMPTYTQGMMDLGATLCTRSQPACERCPLSQMCVGKREGQPTAYPVKTRKIKRSAQTLWLLFNRQSNGAVWLEQRPDKGVWARLFTPALFDDEQALLAVVPNAVVPTAGVPLTYLPAFTHVLTHKDLHLHPVLVQLNDSANVKVTIKATVERNGRWFTPEQWPSIGLPAPIHKLLCSIHELSVAL